MTLSEPGRLKLTDPVELVQGFLAAAVIVAVSTLAIIGKPIPSEVMFIATAVIGFYFGKGVQSGVIHTT